MRKWWMGLALASMLLASCGSGPGQGGSAAASDQAQPNDTSVKYSDGGGALADNGNGTADSARDSAAGSTVSPDLPFGFTIYPGAKVITVSPINLAQGSGKLVVMSSSDTPDNVIAFYKGQAAKAGIVIKRQTTTGGMKLMGGDGPGGIAMVLSAAPGASGTTVQLVVGKGVN